MYIQNASIIRLFDLSSWIKKKEKFIFARTSNKSITNQYKVFIQVNIKDSDKIISSWINLFCILSWSSSNRSTHRYESSTKDESVHTHFSMSSSFRFIPTHHSWTPGSSLSFFLSISIIRFYKPKKISRKRRTFVTCIHVLLFNPVQISSYKNFNPLLNWIYIFYCNVKYFK